MSDDGCPEPRPGLEVDVVELRGLGFTDDEVEAIMQSPPPTPEQLERVKVKVAALLAKRRGVKYIDGAEFIPLLKEVISGVVWVPTPPSARNVSGDGAGDA